MTLVNAVAARIGHATAVCSGFTRGLGSQRLENCSNPLA